MASKYDRIIYGVNPESGKPSSVVVDVYRVVDAFGVKSGAMSHLIKKALCTGLRGHKDEEQDLIDILHSAETALAQYYERHPEKIPAGKPVDPVESPVEKKEEGFHVHYHFSLPEGGPATLKHSFERIGDCIAAKVDMESITSKSPDVAKHDDRPFNQAPRQPHSHPVIMGTDFAVDPDVVREPAKPMITGLTTGNPVPYTPAKPVGVYDEAPAPAPAPTAPAALHDDDEETPEEMDMRLHCERLAEEAYIEDLHQLDVEPSDLE